MTNQDVDAVLKILGPSVELLKGKTVQHKAPMVMQDIVVVLKEIWQYHKQVTLSIDIFCVNSIPYFVTLSLHICFLSMAHLSNRKIPTIFTALQGMHNYYLQRDFQTIDIFYVNSLPYFVTFSL